MRNLEILTKFSRILYSPLTHPYFRHGLSGLVETACLDEFGHYLFVYTKVSCKLYVFKYEAEFPSQVIQIKEVDFSDQDPFIAEAGVVSMDYVQELQGVVITFTSG